MQGSLSGRALIGKLSNHELALSGNISNPTRIDAEHYSGDYVVDVNVLSDIVLDTKRKILDDDITINKPHYVETINPSGGQTVYIG